MAKKYSIKSGDHELVKLDNLNLTISGGPDVTTGGDVEVQGGDGGTIDGTVKIGNSLTKQVELGATTIPVITKGPLQLDDPGSRPLAGANYRGQIWNDQGATLVADDVSICVKDDADAYSWKSLIAEGGTGGSWPFATVVTVSQTNPDADYSSIQAAIDGVAAGSTILVEPGVYHEELDINKDYLSIIGVANPYVKDWAGPNVLITNQTVTPTRDYHVSFECHSSLLINIEINSNYAVGHTWGLYFDGNLGYDNGLKDCTYGSKPVYLDNYPEVMFDNCSIAGTVEITNNTDLVISGETSISEITTDINGVSISVYGNTHVGNLNIDSSSQIWTSYGGKLIVADSATWDPTLEENTVNVGISPELLGNTPFTRLALASRTADPTTGLADGHMWYRSDTDQFKGRRNGATKDFLMTGDDSPLDSIKTVSLTNPNADYSTIQAAIDACDGVNWTKILIDSGEYNEKLVLKNRVHLCGLNQANSGVVDGDNGVLVFYEHTVDGATVSIATSGMPLARLESINILAKNANGSSGLSYSAISQPNATYLELISVWASGIADYGNNQIYVSGITSSGWLYLQGRNCGFEAFSMSAEVITTAVGFDKTENNVENYANTWMWAFGNGTDYDARIGATAFLSLYDGIFNSNGGTITHIDGGVYHYSGAINWGTLTGTYADQSDNVKSFAGFEAGPLLTSGKKSAFKLNLRPLTADPTDVADGNVWYRTDTQKLFTNINAEDRQITTTRNDVVTINPSSNNLIEVIDVTLHNAITMDYTIVQAGGTANKQVGELIVLFDETANQVSITNMVKATIGTSFQDDLIFNASVSGLDLTVNLNNTLANTYTLTFYRKLL